MTIKEYKGTLKGLNFVYLGDGDNNMAHSYLLGCAMVGMNIRIVSPKKYWSEEYYVKEAKKFGVNVAGTNPYISGSPYSELIQPDLSTGRRIAQEIKYANKKNVLDKILS